MRGLSPPTFKSGGAQAPPAPHFSAYDYTESDDNYSLVKIS